MDWRRPTLRETLVTIAAVVLIPALTTKIAVTEGTDGESYRWVLMYGGYLATVIGAVVVLARRRIALGWLLAVIAPAAIGSLFLAFLVAIVECSCLS